MSRLFLVTLLWLLSIPAYADFAYTLTVSKVTYKVAGTVTGSTITAIKEGNQLATLKEADRWLVKLNDQSVAQVLNKGKLLSIFEEDFLNVMVFPHNKLFRTEYTKSFKIKGVDVYMTKAPFEGVNTWFWVSFIRTGSHAYRLTQTTFSNKMSAAYKELVSSFKEVKRGEG